MAHIYIYREREIGVYDIHTNTCMIYTYDKAHVHISLCMLPLVFTRKAPGGAEASISPDARETQQRPWL